MGKVTSGKKRLGKRLIDEVVFVDPRVIIPEHNVDRPEVLEALAAEMERAGWTGRPLVIFRHGSTLYGCTGVHRRQAAINAGLEAIPVIVAPRAACEGGGRFGKDRYRDLVEIDEISNTYVYKNNLDPAEFENWDPAFLSHASRLGIHPEVIEILDNQTWE